jgi:hypothetical protein
MGEEGRQRFRRVFTHERMLDRLTALYLGQLAARQESPAHARREPLTARSW